MEKLCTQHQADVRTMKALDRAKDKIATSLETQDNGHRKELARLQRSCTSLKNTEREFQELVTVS